jgi:hypothetical protein
MFVKGRILKKHVYSQGLFYRSEERNGCLPTLAGKGTKDNTNNIHKDDRICRDNSANFTETCVQSVTPFFFLQMRRNNLQLTTLSGTPTKTLKINKVIIMNKVVNFRRAKHFPARSHNRSYE